MTAKTTCLFVLRVRVWTFDSLDDLLMTLAAGLFGHFAAARCDVNVVVVPARREVVGVPEAVTCFGQVLRYESGWGVTIVAHRDGAMARLHPTAELVLHDVTVNASLGVVG